MVPKPEEKELALTKVLSTEPDVRGERWGQRAIPKCSPSLWPLETELYIAQAGLEVQISCLRLPMSENLPISLRFHSPSRPVTQAPVPALCSLGMPQSTLTQCPREEQDAKEGAGQTHGRNGSAVWDSTICTPNQTHLLKTGRNQQTNRPRERIWGVEKREIRLPDATTLCSHT